MPCRCFLAALACWTAPVLMAAAGNAPDESRAAAVELNDGMSLHGLLNLGAGLWLTGGKGGPRKLALDRAVRIAFSARIDPNDENAALVALNDLSSNEFETREKARARVRALGCAAIRPLQSAIRSPDAETAECAKRLLRELDQDTSAENAADRVLQSDGVELRGQVECEALDLRTRWGRFNIPVERLRGIEFLKPGAVPAAALAAADAKLVEIPAAAEAKSSETAQRWEPAREAAQAAQLGEPESAELRLAGPRTMTMGRIPASDRKTAAVKEGSRLEMAYAPWGVLLSARKKNKNVVAVPVEIFGISRGLSAVAQDSDCAISFIVPGSWNPKTNTGRPGAVTAIGAFVQAHGAGSVGLSAYDHAGRQLACVLNRNESNLAAGGGQRDEFLGIRSPVPIARACFFRADPAKQPAIILDDLVCSRIAAAGRPSDQCALWLRSGECLTGSLTGGKAAAASGTAIRLKLSFLAEPVSVALDEVERYEPAQSQEPLPRAAGAPHAVLLQDGESFYARLHTLDEQHAVFHLPGGAELKLPRQSLRKIDLEPPAPEPGEMAAAPAAGPGEKPGVLLKPQPAASEIKDAKDESDRMDGLEIVAANMKLGELTLRDEAGELTIGLPLVRALVFPPPEKPAAAAPRFREWTVRLHTGSRFEIQLLDLSEKGIEAGMAGGTVTLPAAVIEAVERKRSEP